MRECASGGTDGATVATRRRPVSRSALTLPLCPSTARATARTRTTTVAAAVVLATGASRGAAPLTTTRRGLDQWPELLLGDRLARRSRTTGREHVGVARLDPHGGGVDTGLLEQIKV